MALCEVWDVIVIGAGHNGLIAACYLAKAGKSVLVLERREIVGGACVTEEVWPGYHVSTGAYLCSLLMPEVVRDLELERHGFSVYRRETAGYAPFPDGRALTLFADAGRTRQELERFCAETPEDIEAFFRFEEDVTHAATILEPLLTVRPLAPNLGGASSIALRSDGLDAPTAQQVREAFQAAGVEAFYTEFVTGSVRALLDGRFQSEALKAVLATDGLIGTYGGPSTPGTAYVLLHHYLGRILGSRGAWGYVRGGMGSITQGLAAALREAGGVIRTAAPVKRILTTENTEDIPAATIKISRRVLGVELESGEKYSANVVLSNADPYQTYEILLRDRDREVITATSRARTETAAGGAETPAWQRLKTCGGASVKINLAVTRLPVFKPAGGAAASAQNPGSMPDNTNPQYLGTVHLCPNIDYLERAWEEARNGYPSTAPMIEMYMQSATDATLAPEGCHMVSLFVQYFPYNLAPGLDLETERTRYAERVYALVERYAPGFTQSILHQQILTPRDLEARFGLTGGHIFHGDLLPPDLWNRRSEMSEATAPPKGLFLCGSGAHPGGCVYGAPGFNAAHAVLQRAGERH